MAVLYVRIPDDLKKELDDRAEKGKQAWPPLSLASVVRIVLRKGLDVLAVEEAASTAPRRKVRRGS